jgi:GNAT superfamily N-acetyltransferase
MHREMIYCHIAEIAVRSQHRNQGIGSLSLRAAEDWGRREGAEFASLEISRRKHACQRVLSTADGLLRSIRHRNKAPLVFNRGRRNPSLRLERSRHLTRRAR